MPGAGCYEVQDDIWAGLNFVGYQRPYMERAAATFAMSFVFMICSSLYKIALKNSLFHIRVIRIMYIMSNY